jgi:hypothetical protein
MLASTLERIIEQNLTTVDEIGSLTGVSSSTVYRWMGGQSQPDFETIRLLVRHIRNPDAQRALLTAFTAGTAWQMRYQDEDLDVNGDGHIDANDALDASIRMVRSAGDSLGQIREACRESPPNETHITEAVRVLEEVIHQCCVTQGVLVRMSESSPHFQRRKAH